MGWGQGIVEAQSKADAAMCLAEEIRDILRDMSDSQGGTENVQFTRRPVIIQTDGAGAGSVALDMRAGLDVHLISYSGVTPAAGGQVAFWVDQAMDPTSLLAVGPMATPLFGAAFSEGDQIPEGRDLAVSVTGATPNSNVVVNISAKIVTYDCA